MPVYGFWFYVDTNYHDYQQTEKLLTFLHAILTMINDALSMPSVTFLYVDYLPVFLDIIFMIPYADNVQEAEKFNIK